MWLCCACSVDMLLWSFVVFCEVGLGFDEAPLKLKQDVKFCHQNYLYFLFLLKIICPPSPFYLQLFRGFLVYFPFCLSCPFALYAWCFSPFIYLSKSHLKKKKSGKIASSCFYSKYEIFYTQWIGWSVRNTQDIFQTLVIFEFTKGPIQFNFICIASVTVKSVSRCFIETQGLTPNKHQWKGKTPFW